MKRILTFFARAILAGCFTVKETEFPQTSMTSLPEGKEVSVKLQGFQASVTDYMAVYG